MPTGQDFAEALRTTEEWVEKTDRVVADEVQGETEDGAPVKGYVCRHGDHQVLVLGSEESHFFEIKYDYNIFPEVARQIALANATVGADEVQLTDAHHQQAQQKIQEVIQSRGEENKKLRFNLIQQLSNPECGFSIIDDLGGPHGFSVKKKIFVYEDGFTMADFSSAIQTVISTAVPPQIILAQAFNLDGLVESLSGSNEENKPRPKRDGSRGFQ